MSDQSLAELLVHIQSEVQKGFEFTRFSEERRGAGGITMSMTDIDIELPVEIDQVESNVDLSVLSEGFEKLTEAERAEAWLKLPRLSAGLQNQLDVSATHGGPLDFELESATRIRDVIGRVTAVAGEATDEAAKGSNTKTKDAALLVAGRTLTARVTQSSDAQASDPIKLVKLKLSFKAALRG